MTITMNQEQFIKSYKAYLKKNYDPQKAKKEKQYLYSDLIHFGLTAKQRKQFVTNNKKYLTSLNKKDFMNLAKKMYKFNSFEEKMLALSILNIHKEQLRVSDIPMIERMMKQAKGWALLDSMIIPLMPGIITKNKDTYKHLKSWIKSNDYWVRRSALLAQILLFRRGQGGNKDLFFKMAKSQLNEEWINTIYKNTQEAKRARFFIRKAIGWSLREMSIKDPQSVYQFINDNNKKMSGLSFKEGSRKLPKNLLNKLSS